MILTNRAKELFDRITADMAELKDVLSEINPDKMSLEDLVKYDPLKRSKWYFYHNIKNIPHHHEGKRLYFKKSEIDAWLNK